MPDDDESQQQETETDTGDLDGDDPFDIEYDELRKNENPGRLEKT